MHLTEEQLIDCYYESQRGPEPAEAGHLALCLSCREQYQQIASTLDAFHQLPIPEPPPFVWQRPRRFSFQSWFLVPALATALLVAFFVGRATHTAPVTPAPQLADSGRERILLVALGDHLQRSQMVLLELANGDRATFPASQERARNLLGDNRLYRQTALYSGDARYTALLDDLDRVLTATANAQSHLSTPDTDRLEQLLFRIRVTDSNLARGQEKL